jgi:hypothetical protein
VSKEDFMAKSGKMCMDDMAEMKAMGPKGFAKAERKEAASAMKGAKKPAKKPGKKK